MDMATALLTRVVKDKAGNEYSLVMGDIAMIQQRLPISDDQKPFASLHDVLRFMSSPQGVDIALAQAATKHDPDVTVSIISQSMTEIERFELMGKLIDAFMGPQESSSKTEDAEQPDPLPEAVETGP